MKLATGSAELLRHWRPKGYSGICVTQERPRTGVLNRFERLTSLVQLCGESRFVRGENALLSRHPKSTRNGRFYGASCRSPPDDSAAQLRRAASITPSTIARGHSGRSPAAGIAIALYPSAGGGSWRLT